MHEDIPRWLKMLRRMHNCVPRLCFSICPLWFTWSATCCYPASLGPWTDSIGARKKTLHFIWMVSFACIHQWRWWIPQALWLDTQSIYTSKKIPGKRFRPDTNRFHDSENQELHFLWHCRFEQLNPSVKYDPQWRLAAAKLWWMLVSNWLNWPLEAKMRRVDAANVESWSIYLYKGTFARLGCFIPWVVVENIAICSHFCL